MGNFVYIVLNKFSSHYGHTTINISKKKKKNRCKLQGKSLLHVFLVSYLFLKSFFLLSVLQNQLTFPLRFLWQSKRFGSMMFVDVEKACVSASTKSFSFSFLSYTYNHWYPEEKDYKTWLPQFIICCCDELEFSLLFKAFFWHPLVL